MTNVWFSDGRKFVTSGPLRGVKRRDGWYVVGEGMLIPCVDKHEVDRILAEHKDCNNNSISISCRKVMGVKKSKGKKVAVNKTKTLAPSTEYGLKRVREWAHSLLYAVHSDGKYIKIKTAKSFSKRFIKFVGEQLPEGSYQFYKTKSYHWTGAVSVEALRIRHWDTKRYR